MQAQQSLCHLEKIFLTKDLGTTQLVTTKGNITIYDNSLMHGKTRFSFFSLAVKCYLVMCYRRASI